MANDNQPASLKQTDSAAVESDSNRRDFLGRSTTLAMSGGLAATYGTLAVYAGRFLYPSTDLKAWMFLAPADGIEPGGAVEFETPGGLKIVVTRSAESAPNLTPPVADFLALSSTCPHLGCRVHWEAHNDRFFCPCHNGAFDPQGNPIAGPPKDANQSLPLYALKIEQGLLFIEAPIDQVGDNSAGDVAMADFAGAEEKRPTRMHA